MSFRGLKKLVSVVISGVIFMNLAGTTIIAEARNDNGNASALFAEDFYENETIEFAAANRQQITDFVARMYKLALEREPDFDGINFWINALADGSRTGTQVADFFLNSEELQKKNLSSSAYLDILYSALMGRQSDAGGKTHWSNYLNNGCSRQGILRQFLLSAEFGNICNSYGITRGTPNIKNSRDENIDLTVFVDRIYKQVLERNSKPDELDYWTKEILKNGKTAESVCEFFLTSKEFTDKKHSDDKFLSILYQTCFGRAADAEGLSYWKSVLSRGLSRSDVGKLFIYSAEFSNIIRSMGLTPSKAPPLPKIPTTTPAPKPTPAPTPTPAPVKAATVEDVRTEMLKLVNAHRSANGASALKASDKLNQAAQTRAKETSTYFSHTRPDGRDTWSVYDEVGYKWRAAGENIAMNSTGNGSAAEIAQSLFTQWKNSSGHNKNMLSKDFTEIGIGVYIEGRSVYSAQLFGTPR